jgi:hypothetical protein
MEASLFTSEISEKDFTYFLNADDALLRCEGLHASISSFPLASNSSKQLKTDPQIFFTKPPMYL